VRQKGAPSLGPLGGTSLSNWEKGGGKSSLPKGKRIGLLGERGLSKNLASEEGQGGGGLLAEGGGLVYVLIKGKTCPERGCRMTARLVILAMPKGVHTKRRFGRLRHEIAR